MIDTSTRVKIYITVIFIVSLVAFSANNWYDTIGVMFIPIVMVEFIIYMMKYHRDSRVFQLFLKLF